MDAMVSHFEVGALPTDEAGKIANCPLGQNLISTPYSPSHRNCWRAHQSPCPSLCSSLSGGSPPHQRSPEWSRAASNATSWSCLPLSMSTAAAPSTSARSRCPGSRGREPGQAGRLNEQASLCPLLNSCLCPQGGNALQGRPQHGRALPAERPWLCQVGANTRAASGAHHCLQAVRSQPWLQLFLIILLRGQGPGLGSGAGPQSRVSLHLTYPAGRRSPRGAYRLLELSPQG